ncbi:16S rRNA (cytosine1402-N4)-methyltransferase [Rhizomicrobium palustre]|uniref:Ribosomal RNA small subunit methyltransferase H n=1 Tax=Rhizomicrobium palustre TaxID=189966 RepID=A0A846MWA4_9PROT|nr:16S rRNA (cytosine(1402)-N(4))-methyltransferase RsmH [Rhizomicrobium palustre]NIK87509.1 16S rRNA (cytosine1402-N4)-methyltransferase [Rhizomicrobium palustre]
MSHIPVLLAEVLEALSPRAGERYIDGTFGGGGYTRAILEACDCRVLGIDRDPDAIKRGEALMAAYPGRLTLLHGPFSEMDRLLAGAGEDGVNGVVLDLGVSSFQFDEPARGFSFRADGPLDMRMSADGMSAADFLNTADEREIADVLWQFGEERQSRRIAKAIIKARPISRTMELAELVSEVMGPAAQRLPIHPATRTFQALRIHVNDELGELTRALDAATEILKPEGRLVVVSFHSLEDRIVKRFLTERGKEVRQPSRHAPELSRAAKPQYRLLGGKPVGPSEAEIAANPRARSAKLRAAVRLAA